MKKLRFLFALMFLFAMVISCNKNENDLDPAGKGGSGGTTPISIDCTVSPVLVDPWPSGDAYFECGYVGGCGDWAYKVDNNTADGGAYNADGGAVITLTPISGSEGYSFSWVSTYPVCKVIVKASTKAIVYCYDGAYSGTALVAPEDKQISHVTFCYNSLDECWEEESAWAEGLRYVNKGNWAMYVDLRDVNESKTVDIIADFSNYVNIGTATFSINGSMVNITINLTGAVFHYDVNDPLYDNNLKIQGYSSPPNKSPNPGSFTYKYRVTPGSTTYTVTVPKWNFYGVHLDVALPVACP